MTPEAFRSSLAALSLSQRRAAWLLEVNERTVRRWASGAVPIPGAVRVVLERLEEDQETP